MCEFLELLGRHWTNSLEFTAYHLRDPAVDSEKFWQDLMTYLFDGHSKR